MKDIYNNTVLKRALSPVSVSDNTAQVSQIIDTKGFGAVLFGILIGSVADADATFAVTADESDASDLSGSNSVAAANMVGTLALAGFQFDDDNEVRKILITPGKRYVRITITPTGNASAAVLAAFAQLVAPTYAPVTQPVA
jgi:hypothetical protein